MGLLKRNTVSSRNGSGAGAVRPTDELSAYPALAEFLFSRVWDDTGDKREPGTVLLFADAAGLKLMLNDKDGARVAFAVVDATECILEAVEAMLLSEATDWRPAKKWSPPGKNGQK